MFPFASRSYATTTEHVTASTAQGIASSAVYALVSAGKEIVELDAFTRASSSLKRYSGSLIGPLVGKPRLWASARLINVLQERVSRSKTHKPMDGRPDVSTTALSSANKQAKSAYNASCFRMCLPVQRYMCQQKSCKLCRGVKEKRIALTVTGALDIFESFFM